jgi:hypothetical protein
VFTVRQVVREGARILRVTRDEDDGAWQFLTGGAARTSDGMILALEEIVALDPSVAELADLPLGWTATRVGPGDAWARAPRAAAFTCGTCGAECEGPVLDIGFRRPEAYLRVAEAEREERCFATDDLVCVDGRSWFLRGVLHLPLVDHDDDAALGVWAEVSEEAFDRYRELYDDPRQASEPPFPGTLATAVPGLPPTEGLPAEVRLTSAADRPRLRVLARDHPLATFQTSGLRLQQWLHLHHTINPSIPKGR